MYDGISGWLISAESREGDLSLVIAELARRLSAEGLPLWRMHVPVLATHPEVLARSVRWSRDGGAQVGISQREVLANPAYVGSPVEAILQKGLARVHARLERGEIPYPQLRELRDQGGTDYAAFALELSGGRRSLLSFSTDATGGFRDDQLQAVEAILPALAIRLELESTRFSSETLLEIYLGRNAATRVLAGDFQRGTGQVIHAAIWLCDLRGFTSLADRLPLKALVPVLDGYFEAVAAPIERSGGEILKFIGDSILAVFPTGADAPDACRRAAAAATESIEHFAGHADLKIGVAVNLGDVMYGNVGAKGRLDFTVIGPAVNEAARMESMCKELQTPLVVSESVAQHLADAHPLGSHALRGVTAPRRLFTLARYAGLAR